MIVLAPASLGLAVLGIAAGLHVLVGPVAVISRPGEPLARSTDRPEIRGLDAGAPQVADLDPTSVAWYNHDGNRINADDTETALLRVGVLEGSEDETLELPVTYAAPFTDVYPRPSGVRAQRVLYVTDDGQRANLHVVEVPAIRDRVVGRTDDVITASVMDAEAEYVYYVAVDRDTGADRGIWRVASDGSAEPMRVHRESPMDGTDQGTPASATVAASDDGAAVAALTCAGVEDCTLRIYRPRSGSANVVSGLEAFDLLGVTAEVAVLERLCSPGPNCHGIAIDLESGEETELPDWSSAVMTSVGATDYVVYARTAYGAYSAELAAVNLDTGTTHELGQIDIFGGFLGASGVDVGIDLPPGWIGADFPDYYPGPPVWVAVRITDGEIVRLPALEPAR